MSSYTCISVYISRYKPLHLPPSKRRNHSTTHQNINLNLILNSNITKTPLHHFKQISLSTSSINIPQQPTKMKTTLSLLFTLSLLTLTSAAPPMPISARSPAMHHTSKPTNQARGGTETAAGILNIIGGAIPGPAGQMVGDVGKGLSGGKAAGAGIFPLPSENIA
jgi:hypothetical protein